MTSRASFLFGLLIGSAVAGLTVLYLAKQASVYWVVSEDSRRALELQQEAQSTFRAGNIDRAVTMIRMASAVRAMRPHPSTGRLWPLNYPTVPLYLLLGGIDSDRFAGVSQPDSIQLLYDCIEIVLLMKRVPEDGVDDRLKELKAKFPNASRQSCTVVAAGFFDK